MARAWQGTGGNVVAKLLLLRHAFDTWGAMRVELKTNRLKQRSRGAMLALGAKEESVLRRHMLNEDGTVRDTGFYSILDGAWPEVRVNLEKQLANRVETPRP